MSTKQLTRQKIIENAFELFSHKGYVSTSTREIASASGVAEVTLFRHFTNKETLFNEVLHSFSSLPVLTELLPCLNHNSYPAALTILAERFIERMETNREWIRLMNNEVIAFPESMQKNYNSFMNEVFETLTSFFSEAQKRGAVHFDLKPPHLARSFHSMIFGFYYIEGQMGNKSSILQTRKEYLQSFIQQFCRGSEATRNNKPTNGEEDFSPVIS